MLSPVKLTVKVVSLEKVSLKGAYLTRRTFKISHEHLITVMWESYQQLFFFQYYIFFGTKVTETVILNLQLNKWVLEFVAWVPIKKIIFLNTTLTVIRIFYIFWLGSAGGKFCSKQKVVNVKLYVMTPSY